MQDFENVILTPKNAKSFVPEVLSALASEAWTERNNGCKAVLSLVAMDPTTALALADPVSRALRDERPCVRYRACDCVPVLVKAAPTTALQFDQGLNFLAGDFDPDLADTARETRKLIAPYVRNIFGKLASDHHENRQPQIAVASPALGCS